MRTPIPITSGRIVSPITHCLEGIAPPPFPAFAGRSPDMRNPCHIWPIIRIVCDYYKLTQTELLGRKRPEYISFPRQVAMYLARELTDCSLQTIAAEFRRDHGTVMHACRAVRNRMDSNPVARAAIEAITKELRKA